ncbi:hypothetical protein A167_00782 [Alcanivorax sp. S71-1-4]|uniref:DUF4132 domain-containing protein n=1 Tax=Alcanivorax sp. S71-1-4 TaxID=1177159 RepID=UPI00135A5A89|nr:DUF4132 domain-containing protein [Alcanivorax sp. S71-1-4]KAF0810502.1 hypothetical protein A167_00782 [Alcanivorax sp. S71-1-4]
MGINHEVRKFFFSNPSCDDLIELLDNDPEIGVQKNSSFASESIFELAVMYCRPDLLALLFSRGLRPTEDKHSYRSLIVLAAGGYRKAPDVSLQIIRILLDNGITFPEQDSRAAKYLMQSGLKEALASGDTQYIQNLCIMGLDISKVERTAQYSIISFTISAAYEKYSRMAFPSPEEQARRALSLESMVKFLLQKGCDINSISLDGMGSPLARSLKTAGYPLALELLRKGATFGHGEHLLELLAECSTAPREILDKLLENEDFAASPGQEYVASMLIALRRRNLAFIEYLVKEKGASVNHSSSEETPLSYAVSQKYREAISLLIELGADVNLSDNNGKVPLEVALSLPGAKNIATQLKKLGARTKLQMLNPVEGKHLYREEIRRSIDVGEPWVRQAFSDMDNLLPDQLDGWRKLIRHCLDNNSSKPSSKWLKEANGLIDIIGPPVHRKLLLEWLPLLRQDRLTDDKFREIHPHNNLPPYQISENNTRLLKGLIWSTLCHNDNEIAVVLRELAEQMYKKIRWVGTRNVKIANAAAHTLASMPGMTGVKEVVTLRSKIKYNAARININRILEQAAKNRGATLESLEDSMIPDYGLSDVGELTTSIDACVARVRMTSIGQCEVSWEYKGKTRKSPPAEIARDNAERIKAIKATVKELKSASIAHAARLERMYFRPAAIDFKDWERQYLNHKLIGFMARRLIWRIEQQGAVYDVIYLDASLVAHNGQIFSPKKGATVCLWHPAMVDSEEILAWRAYISHAGFSQPFKQAHREVYLLTDAERKERYHSFRFAHHILKQSQFHALAEQRGWSQTRGGMWCGGAENSATRKLKEHGLIVELEAFGADAYGQSDSGMYACVAVNALKFFTEDDDDQVSVDLKDVDPLVLSEIMRDADLFVGVAGIGNDPNWYNRDVEWQKVSFGKLSEFGRTRRDVLQALVPRLAFKDRLKIEDRFLRVQGNLGTYKIHLGSANVLMEPGDQYLCIVQGSPQSKIMLPFEDDHILSLILSKAALLASDDKITDHGILSQMGSLVSEQA